jgi:hypothetical protein
VAGIGLLPRSRPSLRSLGHLSLAARTLLAERVTSAAPKFGPGWALLAYSRAWQLRYGDPQDDFAAKRAEAFQTVDKALSVDPNAGIAYLARELEPWGCYAEREPAPALLWRRVPIRSGAALAADKRVRCVEPRGGERSNYRR